MAEELLKSPGPFRVGELAEAVRCSERYVRKLVAAGVISAGKYRGRLARGAWLIPAGGPRGAHAFVRTVLGLP